MKGTYSRHRTNTTGLVKLEDRMNSNAIERRTARIATRVGREGALTRGAFLQFLTMGFWDRVRWVLFGAVRKGA